MAIIFPCNRLTSYAPTCMIRIESLLCANLELNSPIRISESTSLTLICQSSNLFSTILREVKMSM